MSLPAATSCSPAALRGADTPAPAPAPPLSVSCQWFYPMVGYVMLFYHRVEPRQDAGAASTSEDSCLPARPGEQSQDGAVPSLAWGSRGSVCRGTGCTGVCVWDSPAGTKCVAPDGVPDALSEASWRLQKHFTNPTGHLREGDTLSQSHQFCFLCHVSRAAVGGRVSALSPVGRCG